MTFVAIDFETAKLHHICAVGIVSVKDNEIVDEYYILVQPPFNEYDWRTIRVHGIRPDDTYDSPTFEQIYPEIEKRLKGKTVVAHNESFDRNVLMKTMADYRLDYDELSIANPWECTLKIYRKKGFKPAKLNACCEVMDVELNHHEALSDARACAQLYIRK